MRVTKKMLDEIERLNSCKLNDSIIAAMMGLDRGTVRYHRVNLGLPRIGIYRGKQYTVYDAKTTQYLFEGTGRECAEFLNIKPETFRHYKCLFDKGKNVGYEIYEVKDDG